MHRHRFLAAALSVILTLAAPLAASAADVLQYVPNDALGFIFIKNLGTTNTKAEQVLQSLQLQFPGPLTFFKLATGVEQGLDPQGDVLLAALPGKQISDKPQLAIWLPVADYSRFVTALEGTPGPGISAVTIAGEDLLVARHGAWALLMDPDQRERIEQMLAAGLNPPAALAAWKDWINANDAAAVALPAGIRAILVWASQSRPASHLQAEPIEPADDDPFGFEQTAEQADPFVAAPRAAAVPNDASATFRAAFSHWLSASPQLAESILLAKAAGCALRLDDNGNALIGLRVSCSDQQVPDPASPGDKKRPPSLYQGGRFVLNGAGYFPPALSTATAMTFVRLLVSDLKTQENMKLDAATVARFQQAAEQAAANVTAAVVLTQPGDENVGVYTNDYFVVRARSADAFVDHASEVMRLWNKMNRDTEGKSWLVFDVEERMVGGRAAWQYSLDVAAADGAPALPEIRQAMEKFFGPGGKLRLWIVSVDERTVLLAAATPEQVATALELLDRKQPISWGHSQPGAVNNLLPGHTDWRLFFSPRGYASWRQRYSEAMTGPVFGARPAKVFPESPPVGVAGGFHDRELRIDVAISEKTIQNAAAYLAK